MADATLLPCPFCDAPASVDKMFPTMQYPWFVSADHAPGCELDEIESSRRCHRTAEAAVASWNGIRQPPSQLPSDDGLIKALETVVSQLEEQNCSTWGLDAGEIHLLDAAREALSRHKAPLSEIQSNKVSKPL